MPEILSESEKRAKLVTGADNKSEEDKFKVMIAVNPSTFARRASYSSENAFDWIVNIINSTNKNTHFQLLIIHVKPPISSIDAGTSTESGDEVESLAAGTSTESGDDVEALAAGTSTESGDDVEALLEFAETFTKKCRDHRIAYEWVRRIGRNPAKEICREVKNLRPDVLVLGKRVPTFFQRLKIFVELK